MKKLKDTKVGKWLKEKSPEILDTVGDLLPDQGALGIVKRLIDSDPSFTAQDKLEFAKLEAETMMNAQDNVTKRWEADMNSDVKLAKLIRPAILIALTLFFMVVMVWDGLDETFEPRESYITLLEIVLLTVFGAYFAGRTIEKTSTIRKR